MPVAVAFTVWDLLVVLVSVNDPEVVVQGVPFVHRALALSEDGDHFGGLPLMLEFGRVRARPAAAPLAELAASAAGVSANVAMRPEMPTAANL